MAWIEGITLYGQQCIEVDDIHSSMGCCALAVDKRVLGCDNSLGGAALETTDNLGWEGGKQPRWSSPQIRWIYPPLREDMNTGETVSVRG